MAGRGTAFARRALCAASFLFVTASSRAGAQTTLRAAVDPGPRTGAAAAGDPVAGLTSSQRAAFEAGKEVFEESEGVGEGLGPRFNAESCGACHSQPASGGSSPATNPQVASATASGARNAVPSFIRSDGPVREVRFKYHGDGTRDGGVHALYVVNGRVDSTGDATPCGIAQEDFESAASAGNAIFRIPTPIFGAGLIEQIPDSAIVANADSGTTRKSARGIRGRPSRIRNDSGTTNVNGNDGTVARFGWKAQNKSLLLFSGEAYNVEMGISNELFPTERDETATCQFAPTPNDVTDTDASGADGRNDVEAFALYMRFLAPPAASTTAPGGSTSIANGRTLFSQIGCADCHTPRLRTGNATVEALRNQSVRLYSDLLLHNMGPGLADDVVQAQAGPDEFRTAPLWGLGQRIFFLHDGRTSDLREAIRQHRSAADSHFAASEANTVVGAYQALSERDKQDLLNFLRSL